jgi:hypothetical protein
MMESREHGLARLVENRVMDRLTAAGERWGVDWLIYNPLKMRMFHRYAVRDAEAVMASIDDVLPGHRRYADVGAGSGAYAAAAGRLGHVMTAYERSRVGRLYARRQGVRCTSFDLREVAQAHDYPTADLAYSFEVAEHLPPDLGDKLVGFLTRTAPLVVFTAASPGQGGTGHINEQPREYWTERFAARGFALDESSALALEQAFLARGVKGSWFPRNIAVYRRADS